METTKTYSRRYIVSLLLFIFTLCILLISCKQKQTANLYPAIYNADPQNLQGLFKGDSLPEVFIWADKIKADPGDIITFTFSVKEPLVMNDPDGKGLRIKYRMNGAVFHCSSPYQWKAESGTHVFSIEAMTADRKFVINEMVVEVSGWEGEFNHPGIFSSEEELDIMKANVNGAAPHRMKDGWDYVRKSKLGSLSFIPTPREVLLYKPDPASRMDFIESGRSAYYHALQWVVTGEQKHADKAIEIYKIWSRECKDIWADDVYKNLITDNYVCVWMAGAEIIRYYKNGGAGWSQKDIAQFDEFVNLLKRISLGWTGFAGDPFRCQNQNGMVASARICIGIYQNDKALFDSGKDLLLEPMFGVGATLGNTPQESAEWSKRTIEIHGKPVNLMELTIKKGTGEMIEINRGGGDLMHANLCFWKMMICAEALRHQGVDLYDMKFDGEKTPRLLLGAEWLNQGLLHPPYQTYAVGVVSPDLPPFPEDECMFHVGLVDPDYQFCPHIEMLYDYYHNRQGGKYSMPFTGQIMSQRIARQGANVNTLTHAGLSKKGK